MVFKHGPGMLDWTQGKTEYVEYTAVIGALTKMLTLKFYFIYPVLCCYLLIDDRLRLMYYKKI